MSQAMFPVPTDERELIELLNAAGQSFSLFEKDGSGFGWLAGELKQAGLSGQVCSQVQIYDGEKCTFQADTPEEALAFLNAVFLMTFSGNSLEDIRRKVEEVKRLDGYAAYQEMKKFRE